MIRRLRTHLSYANVMATIAMFLALGGGAYAATQLPARSVGTRQLRSGAVTPAKLSSPLRAALTTKAGAAGPAGPAGAGGAAGSPGAAGAAGPAGAAGATGAVTGTLPSSATLVGVYQADSSVSPSDSTAISFGYRLATAVTEQVVVPGGAATAHCPGSVANPQAAAGYVCLYAKYGTTIASDVVVFSQETLSGGLTGHTGMVVYTSNGVASGGTWALTAS